MRKFIFCFAFIYVFFPIELLAGTTGKIAGKVVDVETNAPLPGVNIIIEGTTMGAAADINGGFVILNIPPGVYTLRAMMIGYKDMRVENVRVSVDLTTEIDFVLESTVLEIGETVTVVAERPMVVKDLTASTAVIGAEEMAALPVTEVSEVIELQAGLVKDAGGGLHIRGGRSGEISYWVDGIPITDVYDGGTVVDVNKDMVQELQVMSGAFNAEYGQAMSGIVNIITKEGSNRFGGSFTSYIGDHLSRHDDVFMHIDHVNPVAIQNFETSLHGPIIKDKLFFYLNGRHIYSDGWLYGQRRFKPNSVVTFEVEHTDSLKKYAPEYLKDSNLIDKEKNLREFLYIVGTNAYLDSIVTYNNMPKTLRDHPNPDSARYYFECYCDSLRKNNKNGKGDGKYIPMNWNRKIYAQGKLIYRLSPSLKLSYNYILDDVDYTEWSIFDHERDYKYNPDGALKKFRTGQTHIFRLSHALSAKTFYTLGTSYFSKSFEKYVYEDTSDSLYVHAQLATQQPSYSFRTGGTEDTFVDANNPLYRPRFERKTTTRLGKFDLTSQIISTHQIKAGVEFRRHEVFREDITLRPIKEQTDIDLIFESPYIETRILGDSTIYHSRYTHHPMEFSAYLQDKMEFNNMIVNLGVRVDFFEPDGVVLVDESDPSIYNPIKPQNRYHDWGKDGKPNTHDPDGSEGNGIRDQGEPLVTLAERQKYWYKDATSKIQISPRIGVSFPITDRGVIHFSYGYFFQVPRFERLYQNPDFELESGTGNVGVIGNADLEPEQTVSGEIGLQQQLTDDISMEVTGYFRDVRNLAGTQAEEIVIFGGAAKYSKFVNSDFGFIRGVIIALNKRFSGGFSASMDYTLQVAKGSNSDPEQARNALRGGSLPEVQLTSLDWDQEHTVNASVSYAGRGWGASIIGQAGSGLPYTPRRLEDITALLTNSQRKPGSYNADLRAYKDFEFGLGTLTLFMRVFNLFDTLNEVNVYDDTGRAGFTIDKQTAKATNPPELINTLDDWFTNSTHYSEPRRVELGVTYTF